MTNFPDLKNEPESLKTKTRDDEIKNLKYQTEKHDHENILKSLKIDNEYYKKKYKSLNKKKILLIITEILVSTGSAIGSSTMSLINPGAGIIISSSSAYYDILQTYFGQENIHLPYMNTDSFVLSVNTKDIIKDLEKLEDSFDFSN